MDYCQVLHQEYPIDHGAQKHTPPLPKPSPAASRSTRHRTPTPSSPVPPPTFWRPSPRSLSPFPAPEECPASGEPAPPKPQHTCGNSSSGSLCDEWPAPGNSPLQARPCSFWQRFGPWVRMCKFFRYLKSFFLNHIDNKLL